MSKADVLPPFFMNAMPKSGTHLLKQALLGMPGIMHSPRYEFYEQDTETKEEQFYRLGHLPPNTFAAGHLHYNDGWTFMFNRLDMKRLFIHRDLRDVVVSFAYFIVDQFPQHPLHPYLSQLNSQTERYRALIQGVLTEQVHQPDIATWARPYLGWRHDPKTLNIRFETMVRSQASRRKALHQIATYLWGGLTPPVPIPAVVEQMEANISPETSLTFRTGQSGNWRHEFDQELIALFKQVAGDLLIELGYEDDLTW